MMENMKGVFDFVNNNGTIITLALGVIGATRNMIKGSKLNVMRIRGYRSSLLSGSFVLAVFGPMFIMVAQKYIYMIPMNNTQFQSFILNTSIVAILLAWYDAYMKKIVSAKIKRRYYIIYLVIFIQGTVSGLNIVSKDDNLVYLLQNIWAGTWLVSLSVYVLLYCFMPRDDKVNKLQRINILLKPDEIHNCFIRIKCNSKSLKNFDLGENYITLESKQDNLTRIIPMSRIQDITFHY